MQRTHFVFGALGVTASLALSLTGAGCGSDASDDTNSAASGGNQTGAQPPGPPDGAGPGDGAGTVFAIKALYLGDTDRNFKKSSSAWKEYGFNLDGKISTETSTDLCAPRAGGKKTSAYPDGLNGIDNSFGKNIVSLIDSLSPDPSKTVNAEIADGQFTLMLDIDKLGAGANYNPLVTSLYGGAELEAPPKFDGTDVWPVLRELLDGGDIEKPLVKFEKSYLNNNTWVSGTKADINLKLAVAGYTLQLTIGSAVIAMDINEARTGATNGIIAGVIETESFIKELKKVAGAFDPSFCGDNPTVNGITEQLAQASDIMANGTAGSPSVECDGISIGLGFDAAKVQLGAVAPPAEPVDDPCLGSGGAGGAGAGGAGSGGAGGAGSGGAGGGAN
jgi:hypothetical protein